jgi:hypothetical protein
MIKVRLAKVCKFGRVAVWRGLFVRDNEKLSKQSTTFYSYNSSREVFLRVGYWWEEPASAGRRDGSLLK